MYKAMIAIAAASVVVVAGCATQPSGAGASNVTPPRSGNAPMPVIGTEPPWATYNRWGYGP